VLIIRFFSASSAPGSRAPVGIDSICWIRFTTCFSNICPTAFAILRVEEISGRLGNHHRRLCPQPLLSCPALRVSMVKPGLMSAFCAILRRHARRIGSNSNASSAMGPSLSQSFHRRVSTAASAGTLPRICHGVTVRPAGKRKKPAVWQLDISLARHRSQQRERLPGGEPGWPRTTTGGAN
jgi:hypothetical protein